MATRVEATVAVAVAMITTMAITVEIVVEITKATLEEATRVVVNFRDHPDL